MLHDCRFKVPSKWKSYLASKIFVVRLQFNFEFALVLSDGNATSDLALSLFNGLVHSFNMEYIVMRCVRNKRVDHKSS